MLNDQSIIRGKFGLLKQIKTNLFQCWLKLKSSSKLKTFTMLKKSLLNREMFNRENIK